MPHRCRAAAVTPGLLHISLCALVLVQLGAEPALAHTPLGGVSGGFASGFLHPILGWDHALAMIAVGLWGAFLGPPAIWILPVVFPLVMVAGGVLGMAKVSLPMVESGIALSLIVLGALIALGQKAPMAIAAIIVGAFAIFHGHAHGAELPSAVSPVAYSAGFVIATGLLHAAGIAFGTLLSRDWGRLAIRGGGGAIALLGLALLIRG